MEITLLSLPLMVLHQKLPQARSRNMNGCMNRRLSINSTVWLLNLVFILLWSFIVCAPNHLHLAEISVGRVGSQISLCEGTITDFEVLYECPRILGNIGCGFEVAVEPL